MYPVKVKAEDTRCSCSNGVGAKDGIGARNTSRANMAVSGPKNLNVEWPAKQIASSSYQLRTMCDTRRLGGSWRGSQRRLLSLREALMFSVTLEEGYFNSLQDHKNE